MTPAESCRFGTAASSLSTPIARACARRVQLVASIFPGFIRNQLEVSPRELDKTGNKKRLPNIKRGGKCFIISSGCHDFSQEAHNPDFSFISVSSHSRLAAFFFFFAAPKYYTGNWNHIGAVRTAEGETSAPLDLITIQFAPVLLGEMMVPLVRALTHGSA